MVKVRLLYLNGYDGWNIQKSSVVELKEFTPEALTEHVTDGETSNPNDMSMDGPVVKEGAISLLGEENGYIAVIL